MLPIFNSIKKRRKFSIICLLSLTFAFFFFLILPRATLAATLYANYATGNDTTGDGSAGLPYKTFHKAYSMASGGDTLDLTGTFSWANADETGDAQTSGYTIGKNIILAGHGADQTIFQAAASSGSGDRRVFT